jgi:type II secretory pathway pseudopilin PulG
MRARLTGQGRNSLTKILRRFHIAGRRHSVEGDSGDTLIEALIAVLIVAVAGVAIAGAFASLIDATVSNKALSTEMSILRSYAGVLIEPPGGNSATTPGVGYIPCATASSYSVPSWFTYADGLSTPPTGYDAPAITKVQVWTGSFDSNNGQPTWQAGTDISGCSTGSTDPGLQQITISEQQTSGGTPATLTVLKAEWS